MKRFGTRFLTLQAGIIAGVLCGASNGARANNFGDIASNMVDSIEELPGLISGVSYMIGLLLGILGVLKLKDHVENPGNTPLKDGAIRMVAGGALFALPMVFEAMRNTIGETSVFVRAAEVNRVEFNLR